MYVMAIKKNEILTCITAWMDLEGEMLDREKQTSYDFTYMYNLKTKKQTSKRDAESRLMFARREGWRGAGCPQALLQCSVHRILYK